MKKVFPLVLLLIILIGCRSGEITEIVDKKHEVDCSNSEEDIENKVYRIVGQFS